MTDTLARATTLLEEQQFQEALQLFRTVSPATPAVKVGVARALSGLGQWQEAHGLFTEVLEEAPGCHEAYAGRGLLCYLTGQFPRAKADYDKAVESAPDNGRYRGLRGMLAGQVGDVPNALQDLEAAYELGETEPAYLLARAQLHLSVRDLPKAKRLLELAEHHKADEAALSALEGALSVMAGQPQEALASYRFAVEAAPHVADYWMNMLILTSKVSRGRLLSEVQRALEAHPDNEEIIQLAVGAHLEKGQTREAFGILKEALRRNPDSPLLHFQLGMGLANLGKFEKAVESFTAALELRPRFPRALDARGNCLERLGKEEEAKRDFEESHRIRREDAERAAARSGRAPAATNGTPEPSGGGPASSSENGSRP